MDKIKSENKKLKKKKIKFNWECRNCKKTGKIKFVVDNIIYICPKCKNEEKFLL
jgi:hypothetical protein